VPFAWFAADEEFGQNPGLRAFLEERKIPYVMAIPKNTELTGLEGHQQTIEEAARQVRPHDWQRRCCGIGSKGFRVYDWPLLNAGQPSHQHMIRRSIDDGELAYYHCHNPRGEGFGELVRAAGMRWPIEESFEAAKGEAGLDNYQVRLCHAWYRHITLAMLALAFLAVMRHKSKKGTRHLWTIRTA
jgi:SRSO17 transposase